MECLILEDTQLPRLSGFMTLLFIFLSEIQSAVLTPALSSWSPGRDLARVLLTASVYVSGIGFK